MSYHPRDITLHVRDNTDQAAHRTSYQSGEGDSPRQLRLRRERNELLRANRDLFALITSGIGMGIIILGIIIAAAIQRS